jgi:hypothetical protein
MRRTQELEELDRPMLHRLLAARSGHGDFARYHERFRHYDAVMTCVCRKLRSPSHIFYCNMLCCPRAANPRPANVSKALGKDWTQFADLAKRSLFFHWNCPRGKNGASGLWGQHLRRRGTFSNFHRATAPLLRENPQLASTIYREIQSHDRSNRSRKESKRHRRRRPNGWNSAETSGETSSSAEEMEIRLAVFGQVGISGGDGGDGPSLSQDNYPDLGL